MARVVSGMRPTGGLHLGHLRGVLQNWRAFQDAGDECFFFVADWHALTTDYASPGDLSAGARKLTAAWLAAGIDPSRATIFRQSDVPAHAELCILLSMICPLPWLTHLPTYKELKEQARRDLDTHGFLSYPLLQSADIMIYAADFVPVGEDQMPHVEIAREIARRFNRFYGRAGAFPKKRREVAAEIGASADGRLRTLQKQYAETGDKKKLQTALDEIAGLSLDDCGKKILCDDIRYGGAEILRPPRARLTPTPRLPGTDGRKMSKSYDNAIELFDPPETVRRKIARMPTDPARVRRSDPGEPERCPAWRLHEAFSDKETREWAAAGCRSAAVGCVECKGRLCECINAELAPILARREECEAPGVAEDVLADGARRARTAAAETLQAARRATGIAR
ncbi:MAG: tryptophan--tRNA ligase [Gammaproteobacteria bacterium]